jgi:hypothetical protein
MFDKEKIDRAYPRLPKKLLAEIRRIHTLPEMAELDVKLGRAKLELARLESELQEAQYRAERFEPVSHFVTDVEEARTKDQVADYIATGTLPAVTEASVNIAMERYHAHRRVLSAAIARMEAQRIRLFGKLVGDECQRLRPLLLPIAEDVVSTAKAALESLTAFREMLLLLLSYEMQEAYRPSYLHEMPYEFDAYIALKKIIEFLPGLMTLKETK